MCQHKMRSDSPQILWSTCGKWAWNDSQWRDIAPIYIMFTLNSVSNYANLILCLKHISMFTSTEQEFCLNMRLFFLKLKEELYWFGYSVGLFQIFSLILIQFIIQSFTNKLQNNFIPSCQCLADKTNNSTAFLLYWNCNFCCGKLNLLMQL